jgi:tetratricopeptide (TPR) repeat protein
VGRANAPAGNGRGGTWLTQRLSGRYAGLILGALVFTTAGSLTVRGRPLTFAAATRSPEAEPEIDLAAAREESARQDRAILAFHRRELRRHPEESQPHAWAAFDLMREMLERAQLTLTPGQPRASAPTMSEFSRQRQIYEQRQLQLEKYVSQHFRRDALRAIRHAEKAFRFAANPGEEMQARRLLGDADRLAGRYDDALRQFFWLASVEPYGDRGMIQRCYAHKGMRLRWENRGGSYWAYVGGRPWPIGVRSVQAYILANQRWARRWPRATTLRARLGNFYYALALQEAVQQADFPRPGRDFGKRVDACIYHHARHRVVEGIHHFQAALAMAEKPGDRARALTELGHGYLMSADYGRCIPLLKKALVEEPWNRSAQEYLRQAYRRRGWGHDHVITALRPPPGWYSENYGGLSVNSAFFSYGAGVYRLSADDAREARAYVTLLRRPSRGPGEAVRRQEARNRLDEILPGTGTRYQTATGDVLATDLDRASARLDQLHLSGAIYPSSNRKLN